MSTANVLSIAGVDPSGGAGIIADLKTFAALGTYGMAAISALTAQNTQGVSGIHRTPAEFLAQQLHDIATDIRMDAIKIGMLFDAEIIETVAHWLQAQAVPIVVLDPVMVATSGDRLLVPEAESALAELVRLADVVTPNIPELAVLASHLGNDVSPATSLEEAINQARVVAEATNTIVLAKGGHLDGFTLGDALVFPDGQKPVIAKSPRVDTKNTHGTGCSFSSAFAAIAAKDRVAQDTHADTPVDWEDVLQRAKFWMTHALVAADDLEVGKGHGPINHLAHLWKQGGTEPDLSGEAILELWWEAIAPLRDAIDELDFVKALGDGTLEQYRFVNYQIQDAMYLSTYSRVLAAASSLAPHRDAQAFWAKGAHECIEVEMALHDSWIPEGVDEQPMDEVTMGYTNHLLSRAQLGNYGELIAAILPCYWLYQDIGDRLLTRNHSEHTYKSWLDMYGDAAFAESTLMARALVAQALEGASVEQQQKMFDAFYESSLWELEFFDR